jgi:transposase
VAPAELSERGRHAPTLVEARRWQLLAIIADGKTTTDAAALVGLQEDYAGRVVRRHNREGPESLRDHRLGLVARQRPPLLSPDQQQELAAAIAGPAPGGGLWNGPAVARWIAERTGREHVAPQRGHDYRKRLGLSP